MARPLRIEYPGAFYHITSRGNARQNIFKNNRDFIEFLNILKETTDRYSWECYAYCLMSNHYHLLIKTLDPNLSQGMRQLNGVYTQKFNYLHKTVGHLFQGRYKAILVDEEKYFYELVRYIVLNPVRAKMVKNLENYRWSSHQEILKENKKNICVREKVIERFESLGKYKEYINLAGVDDGEVWEDLKGSVVLGSFEFVENIKRFIKKERKESVNINKVERYVGRPPLDDLFREKNIMIDERNALIFIAHIDYGYTLSEISQKIGLHISVVSRAVKKQVNAKNKT